jgi:hypothetical protein
MSEDIIETLRRFARGAQEQNATDAVSGLLAAAEEIERLRRDMFDNLKCARAAIERLTAERDEARRMWCENGTYTHPRQLAKEMRWDCYKEVSR